MPKKLTYEEVKSYIESQGYQLLSKEYKNAHAKLQLQCLKGHIFYMRYVKFKSGQRCPICMKIKSTEKRKLSYEYVKSFIESYGYKLLSDEYINYNKKLKIKCNKKNHIFETSFDYFQRRPGCPICNNKNKGLHNKYSHEYVNKYLSNKGYQLLSKYKNVKDTIKIQCPQKHIFYMSFGNFNQGHRCPICHNKNRGFHQRLSYEYVKEYIELFDGYKLLSKKYRKNSIKLNIQCPKGHKFKMTYSNFKNGQRCPICVHNSKSSNMEKEIQNYCKLIYNGKIINNDRQTILNPNTQQYLELDIYLPDLNKAIEFNGDYWHSKPDRIVCDRIKKEECKNNNIELLVIKEKE
ncbi:MAG: hypothetical protein ACOCV1_06660 [Bacillota bacterium]